MTAVSIVETGPRRVSRSVEVDASSAELFALLADPHEHEGLDGSGTVHAAVSGPSRLTKGSTFSVRMRQYGIPYRITSTVVAFEPDRLIEWRHPLGHTWRWELAPLPSGSTLVTETFDYSRTPAARLYELTGRTTANVDGITRTLEGLRDRFAAASPAG